MDGVRDGNNLLYSIRSFGIPDMLGLLSNVMCIIAFFGTRSALVVE